MKKYVVMIEKDLADKNVVGYVPELRLSAVGDNEEEMMANLKDVIAIEEERKNKLPLHEFSLTTINYVKGGE